MTMDDWRVNDYGNGVSYGYFSICNAGFHGLKSHRSIDDDGGYPHLIPRSLDLHAHIEKIWVFFIGHELTVNFQGYYGHYVVDEWDYQGFFYNNGYNNH